ncbi:MAG TPA: acyl-CoA dehydrogenase family protein [Stellaceae bacterium]|nr:acyl-CoA dehydrogenase family protein [Stellaceae bacterium]
MRDDDGHDAGRNDAGTPLDRARSLGPLIDSAADEIEQRRELPPRLVRALIESGMYALLKPRSLGGEEMPPHRYFEVVEEIARHDASAAWCVGQSCGCSMSAAYLSPEVARTIFGPPDGIVGWGPPGPAKALTVPGGFKVSGSWSFASGSHHASWLGAHVSVFTENGAPMMREDGSAIMRTLLFPKSAAKMTDIWHVIGLRGTGSDTWTVEDLFVAEDFTINRDPSNRPREQGALYRFSSSNVYASAFAGVALGVARGVLDSFIELARDKIPRGAKVTMRNNNVIQSQVAQVEARLSSARRYVIGVLEESWDHVSQNTAMSLDENATLRLATTWAIHQARDCVDMLYQAAGATAIFNTNPFERRFRDIHTIAQQMQARQTHFETVGRIRMGLPPDATMFTF